MDNKTALAAALAQQTGLDPQELSGWLETPPDPAMGDYAFPCFRLAKSLRKAPPAIAAELAASLPLPPGIARCEAKGGYLNFFADQAAYAGGVLARVLEAGQDYGKANLGGGRHVCMD